MIYRNQIDLEGLVKECCEDAPTFNVIKKKVKAFKAEYMKNENVKTPSWLLLYIVIISFVGALYRGGDKMVINNRDVNTFLEMNLEDIVKELINLQASNKLDDEALFEKAYNKIQFISDDLYGDYCYKVCKHYTSML
ncbi:hypothetical protein [Lutispora sp.]|uniref:hypothetical protein n=1 Tax=Lutispora sp. TaxID=2828727 RepID=UPI0035662B63